MTDVDRSTDEDNGNADHACPTTGGGGEGTLGAGQSAEQFEVDLGTYHTIQTGNGILRPRKHVGFVCVECDRTGGTVTLQNSPSSPDEQQGHIDSPDEEERARREDSRRLWVGLLLLAFYALLVAGGVVVMYKSISDLIFASKHPVRSINFKTVEQYEPPGIVVFPNGHTFLGCGHYFNNIMGAKVTLEELDLDTHNCTQQTVTYHDPHHNISRDLVVFRGPTDVDNVEAIFLHFAATNTKLDFYTVSYYLFPRWDDFNNSPSPGDYIAGLHGKRPTFAISANLRMWIKMSLKEIYFVGESEPKREFSTEASVVQFLGDRSGERLFFLFFEWKSGIVEQSFHVYAVTPWSLIASLCGLLIGMWKASTIATLLRKRMTKVKEEVKKRKTIKHGKHKADKAPENNALPDDQSWTCISKEEATVSV